MLLIRCSKEMDSNLQFTPHVSAVANWHSSGTPPQESPIGNSLPRPRHKNMQQYSAFGRPAFPRLEGTILFVTRAERAGACCTSNVCTEDCAGRSGGGTVYRSFLVSFFQAQQPLQQLRESRRKNLRVHTRSCSLPLRSSLDAYEQLMVGSHVSNIQGSHRCLLQHPRHCNLQHIQKILSVADWRALTTTTVAHTQDRRQNVQRLHCRYARDRSTCVRTPDKQTNMYHAVGSIACPSGTRVCVRVSKRFV